MNQTLTAFGKNETWVEPVLNYSMQYAYKVKQDYNNFRRGQ